MNKKSKALIIIGVVLVVLGTSLLLTSRVSFKKTQQNAQKIVGEIEALFPDRVDGVIEDFSTLEMPVLDIENQDIVGIIEIPKFNIKLPVKNDFSSKVIGSLPMRFSGSAYDGSLIISGSDNQNQFNCAEKLDIDDSVNVVDMTGAEFTYKISEIFRSKSATADSVETKCDLMLIIKLENAFEYVVVCCTLV